MEIYELVIEMKLLGDLLGTPMLLCIYSWNRNIN